MCKYCEQDSHTRKPIGTFEDDKAGAWTMFIDEYERDALSFTCADPLAYLTGDTKDGFEMQGWAKINYCPMCGRKLH